MAVQINGISLPVRHSPEALRKKVLKTLRLKDQDLLGLTIRKRSVDARKKEDIRFNYILSAEVKNEKEVLRRAALLKGPVTAGPPDEPRYMPPEHGISALARRPVIIGTGPAGLFAGLLLAEQGYRPVLLERGEKAEDRLLTVRRFCKDGTLDPESNVSFGEGGAGTFSDGKLNTLVKDRDGRIRHVLETFVRFGAEADILTDQKPHVGTDRLIKIVGGIRKEIERLGGEVCFGRRAEHLLIRDSVLQGVTGTVLQDGSPFTIKTDILILAPGHSARDSFLNFLSDGVPMQEKSFAVGLRVQHDQHFIDVSQYGEKEADFLSPAPYKLTAKSADGRGVYTFCMCPGGYVVNASSENGRTAVNGMSYHDRGSGTANSAVIVSVTPEDYTPFGDGPLSGVRFQEALEERAFRAGNGRIPVQLYGDFCSGQVSGSFGGSVSPKFCGETAFADLRAVLGETLSRAFEDGMTAFDRKIKGFASPETILAGVESRTSSPVRIPRDSSQESAVRGLYPCGEGAGYAGGITSAAADGLRVAESIIRRFSAPEV